MLLLLKTWYKRTQHPFTAHLGRKTTNEGEDKAANGEGEKEEDQLGNYSDYDLEYESDSESLGTKHFHVHKRDGAAGGGGGMSSKPAVNESLTNRKYCYSTKLFYEIFRTDAEFKAFYAAVHAAR